MRNRTGITLFISAFLLSACASMLAPDVNPSDPQAVARAISIKRDEFKKVTNYTGPDAANFPDSVFIRAWKPDNGRISYQIYVRDQYEGDWRYYDSAHDANGNRLVTTLIDREVLTCHRGCTLWEHLGINVSREYLEKQQHQGIRFKISGKAGEEIFFIPPAYIKAFLAVVK